MSIVFFGTPQFAVPSLDALIQSGEDVAAVVTQPDKEKGRGHRLSRPPVKEWALDRGIKVLQPEKMKGDFFMAELSIIRPEFIVVVAFGKILTREILGIPKSGCINVHASLLPKYRGAAPIPWAIINGEKVTGVTTMLMDEGLDTGDILLQEGLDIADDDSSDTLGRRLSGLGAMLLVKTIKGIRAGSINPKPQQGEATYASVIKKEDGKINWSKTASEIVNFVRGMHPWPGAYCFLNKERIKFIKVKALDGSGSAGRIEKIRKDEFIVGTGNLLLSVLEIQPEGKKIMSAASFLRGRNIKEGVCFDET